MEVETQVFADENRVEVLWLDSAETFVPRLVIWAKVLDVRLHQNKRC